MIDWRNGAVQIPTNSGPVYNTLVDWKRVWHSGAVPQQILTTDIRQFRDSIRQGRHTIAIGSSDLVLSKNAGSAKYFFTNALVPRITQNWGTPIGSILSVVRTESSTNNNLWQHRKLLYSISHGTGPETFAFAQSALIDRGLLSPYKTYMNSDSVRKILKSKLDREGDVDVLLELLDSAESADDVWNTIWHEELAGYTEELLRSYLRDDTKDPSHVISQLNRKIALLMASYGYGG